MSIQPCAFLEAALRCEERAVQNRSHREHTAHDGTCSSRRLSGASLGEGTDDKRTMSKSAQKIGASHDGQREWARFHNLRKRLRDSKSTNAVTNPGGELPLTR